MRNIILIGFMGAGKTTFGEWFAKKNGYEFIDTDEMIEAKQQISIAEIFREQGEDTFRDMETGLVMELLSERTESKVISVGGGLPVRPENRELLKKLGCVVYLRATVDTLCQRLAGDTTRPLLQGGSVRDKIIELMDKRAVLYEDGADLVIDTDRMTCEDIEKKIEECGL